MNKNQMKRMYKINENISIMRKNKLYYYVFDNGNSEVEVKYSENPNYELHDYIKELLGEKVSKKKKSLSNNLEKEIKEDKKRLLRRVSIRGRKWKTTI